MKQVYEFLLGATEDDELVFGEFRLEHPSYWKDGEYYTDESYVEFSASFYTVRPFREEDYDLEEYYEEWLYGMDKEYLYDRCEQFDCRPSELAECLAEDCYDIRDAIDCSLYPEEINIDGDNWYFESSACGQHDTRENMMVYTDYKSYELLHTLWDNYHLKKVDEEVIKQVENLAETLSKIDEEKWITNYIKDNLK